MDLREVNRVLLKRVGHPLDSSAHILKSFNPDDMYYAVCDLSMSYHQLELDPEPRDIFAIVFQRGKFRYACMPQGAGPSSDLFNIHTDPQLKGCSWVYRNVDDILTAAPTPGELDEKMETVRKVCVQRNMKLSLSKFQCPHQVTFEGVIIES